MKHLFYYIVLLTLLTGSGCKKFVVADLPADRTADKFVYSNIAMAVSAMNGVYANLAQVAGSFCRGLGLISDEIYFSSAVVDGLPKNDFSTGQTDFIWELFYSKCIYPSNSMIEGLRKYNGIPEDKRNILVGEAKFIRAFSYFYLVNLYGEVPLVITTDFNINSNIARSSIDKVYNQIIQDLESARELLSDEYMSGSLMPDNIERVRPNKSAAMALLARVYLYRQNWVKAVELSTLLIENESFYRLIGLDNAFLKNNKETIWAIQPDLNDPNGNVNTREGISFVASGQLFDIGVYPYLLEAFELGDNRKDEWVGVYNTFNFPYKYKVGDVFSFGVRDSREYSIVLRISEQYLIRAEARAFQNKLTGSGSATADIDSIRIRSGLSGIAATSQEDIIEAIMHERQVELFTEWGHRWLDLKRTDKLDNIMSVVTPAKGGIWDPYKALFPIPYSEFIYNPALRGHQNAGYPEAR